MCNSCITYLLASVLFISGEKGEKGDKGTNGPGSNGMQGTQGKPGMSQEIVLSHFPAFQFGCLQCSLNDV